MRWFSNPLSKKKKRIVTKSSVSVKLKVMPCVMEHILFQVLCTPALFCFQIYVHNNLCPFMEIKTSSEPMFSTEACQTVPDMSQQVMLSFMVEPLSSTCLGRWVIFKYKKNHIMKSSKLFYFYIFILLYQDSIFSLPLFLGWGSKSYFLETSHIPTQDDRR